MYIELLAEEDNKLIEDITKALKDKQITNKRPIFYAGIVPYNEEYLIAVIRELKSDDISMQNISGLEFYKFYSYKEKALEDIEFNTIKHNIKETRIHRLKSVGSTAHALYGFYFIKCVRENKHDLKLTEMVIEKFKKEEEISNAIIDDYLNNTTEEPIDE